MAHLVIVTGSVQSRQGGRASEAPTVDLTVQLLGLQSG